MLERGYFRSRLLTAAVALAALIYTAIMIKLLFLRDRYYTDYAYNLVPLRTIGPLLLERERFSTDAWVKNLFGNIVLFIPPGVLLPLLNRSYLRAGKCLAVLAASLLAVELIQLVTRLGSFDVDDLLLNLLGGLIGYACVRLFARRR